MLRWVKETLRTQRKSIDKQLIATFARAQIESKILTELPTGGTRQEHLGSNDLLL
jgi:hypothetical protein